MEEEEKAWLAMQFKVMDILTCYPLLIVYALITVHKGKPDEDE